MILTCLGMAGLDSEEVGSFGLASCEIRTDLGALGVSALGLTTLVLSLNIFSTPLGVWKSSQNIEHQGSPELCHNLYWLHRCGDDICLSDANA